MSTSFNNNHRNDSTPLITTTTTTERQQQQQRQQKQDPEEKQDGTTTSGTAPSLLVHPTPPPFVPAAVVSRSSNYILYHFILMSILFSLNHGCVVSCLGLASIQLGALLGGIQSFTLYIFYTGSALTGISTYITKQYGSRNSIMIGMASYILYVMTFWMSSHYYSAAAASSTTVHSDNIETYIRIATIFGAAIGGIGAGFLWTAQGTYFATAAELHNKMIIMNMMQQQQQEQQQPPGLMGENNDDDDTILFYTASSNDHNGDYVGRTTHVTTTTTNTSSSSSSSFTSASCSSSSTSYFAGIFAFIYLSVEVISRFMSTFFLTVCHYDWSTVFAIYSIITILSTIFMIYVDKLEYHNNNDNNNDNDDHDNNITASSRQQHQQSDLLQQQQQEQQHEEHHHHHQGFNHSLQPLDGGGRNDDDDDDNVPVVNTSSSLSGTNNTATSTNTTTTTTTNTNNKFLAAWNLLLHDPKMKYMIGLNAVFGFESAYLNSYVNGEVVSAVLQKNDTTSGNDYVGGLTAYMACIAAIMSLYFGTSGSNRKGNSDTSNNNNNADNNDNNHNRTMTTATAAATTTTTTIKDHNGPILYLGAICFSAIPILLLLFPPTPIVNTTMMSSDDSDKNDNDNILLIQSTTTTISSTSSSSSSSWFYVVVVGRWLFLLFIYTLHGIGRSTFEGTLKATFADYFGQEDKEGAFANIILQNGISSAIGYILSFALTCNHSSSSSDNNNNNNNSRYCVRYHNDSDSGTTLHDVLSFEILIIITGLYAIWGYYKASSIFSKEQQQQTQQRI